MPEHRGKNENKKGGKHGSDKSDASHARDGTAGAVALASGE
jgi:hypothetical protein